MGPKSARALPESAAMRVCSRGWVPFRTKLWDYWNTRVHRSAAIQKRLNHHPVACCPCPKCPYHPFWSCCLPVFHWTLCLSPRSFSLPLLSVCVWKPCLALLPFCVHCRLSEDRTSSEWWFRSATSCCVPPLMPRAGHSGLLRLSMSRPEMIVVAGSWWWNCRRQRAVQKVHLNRKKCALFTTTLRWF